MLVQDNKAKSNHEKFDGWMDEIFFTRIKAEIINVFNVHNARSLRVELWFSFEF